MIDLMCGDCLELITKIPDGTVQTVLMDPPYFQGMTCNGKRARFCELATLKPFWDALYKEIRRVLNPERGCVYQFCDWRSYAFYYPILDAVMGVRNCLVWDKISGAGNFYTFRHEWILFWTFDKKFHVKDAQNIIRQPSFASGVKKTEGEKMHPAQKPFDLVQRLILDSTKEGDTVLDPFMGSGTTGAVCQKLRRKFYGFEIDETYFETARKRIFPPVGK